MKCAEITDKVIEAIEKVGGILCLTADHGNSDDMYEHKKDGSVAKGADGEPNQKHLTL